MRKIHKTSKTYEANLERGYPTVDAAMKSFEQALAQARAYGYKIVKFIHGYGSNGSGGKIKEAVLKELARCKSAGKIREFVAGENFSSFDSATQRIIAAYPNITKDKDYSKANDGITIVLI